MPPLALDPQPHLTEPLLQPSDSTPNRTILTGIDDSALSNGKYPQVCHNDSLFPPKPETEVRRLLKRKPVSADALSKRALHDHLGVTEEARKPSLDCHDIVPGHGNVPSEKHGHKVSVSSGTDNLSELSWEGGYESSGSVKPPYLTVDCSECDLGLDGLDKDSAVS
jgi:hypothetical protein